MSAVDTDGADSCALNAVCFLTETELAAVNAIGQMKIWDIRQHSAEPVHIYIPSVSVVLLIGIVRIAAGFCCLMISVSSFLER